MDEADAMDKCISAVEGEDDTVVSVSQKQTKTPKMTQKSAEALVTRSDVPMDQWENISDWGPDVQWVEQARAETQQMPKPGPVGTMPDTLQQFVTETNGISTQVQQDQHPVTYKDEAPPYVVAWQNFAANLANSSTTGEGYIKHLRSGGNVANYVSNPVQVAPQVLQGRALLRMRGPGTFSGI